MQGEEEEAVAAMAAAPAEWNVFRFEFPAIKMCCWELEEVGGAEEEEQQKEEETKLWLLESAWGRGEEKKKTFLFCLNRNRLSLLLMYCFRDFF